MEEPENGPGRERQRRGVGENGRLLRVLYVYLGGTWVSWHLFRGHLFLCSHLFLSPPKKSKRRPRNYAGLDKVVSVLFLLPFSKFLGPNESLDSRSR